jgi:hypothetical protein
MIEFLYQMKTPTASRTLLEGSTNTHLIEVYVPSLIFRYMQATTTSTYEVGLNNI